MTNMRRPARGKSVLRSGAHLGALLSVFVASGAVSGFLWDLIWEPPTGVVYDGRWLVITEDGLRSAFSATGWFVALSLVFAVVLGVVAGLVSRERELMTLAGVMVGSVLAALVMWRVGLALSAPDPDVLARGLADQTPLEGRIAVGGWSPFLAYPLGAVFGLLLPYVLIADRGTHHADRAIEPDRSMLPR